MRRYFREHLAFLAQGGKQLASAFPQAASRLAARTLDPDVEVLLCGIAHITGTIEEKHDQMLPEACQLIFDTLFPHYLSPLPSTTIVELEGDAPVRLPRGTMLESAPIMGTSCRFRTAFDAELGGVFIREIAWKADPRQSRLEVQLDLRPDQPIPERLRLHLGGDALTSRMLYVWLQKRLRGIEILDDNGKPLTRPGALRLETLGYGEDESLFPYPDCSFDGFRLVQEYFALPQKFLFVDVLGFGEALTGQPRADRVVLCIDLMGDGSRFNVGSGNVRLSCTPVVNLFEHAADPLSRHPGRVDYLIRPSGATSHYMIYRVLAVSGFSRDGLIEYPVASELDLGTVGGGFCQLHRRELNGQVFVYVSVDDGHSPPPMEQTLLCDLLCSNGPLPLMLRVGDSLRHATGSARILTPITRPVAVDVGEALNTRLATHLTLSQVDLTSVEALRELITLYDFPATTESSAANAQRNIRESLLKTESHYTQRSYHLTPVWGRCTVLTVDESTFDNDGELFLFGSIVNEVIALSAPINTFSEVIIKKARSQETLRWPSRLGHQVLEPS